MFILKFAYSHYEPLALVAVFHLKNCFNSVMPFTTTSLVVKLNKLRRDYLLYRPKADLPKISYGRAPRFYTPATCVNSDTAEKNRNSESTPDNTTYTEAHYDLIPQARVRDWDNHILKKKNHWGRVIFQHMQFKYRFINSHCMTTTLAINTLQR